MPYVARTPLAQHIEIGYDQPAKTGKVLDPWDSWVFKISGNTYVSGEETYRNLNFWSEFGTRRITEGSKIEFEIYWSYNENLYKYTVDSENVTTLSLSRSKGASASYVFSLTPHWSAGGYATVSSSTYNNRDYRIEASPAIEYNVFPYRQSTRRQLRLAYHLTPSYVKYIEETIFDKTNEWLFSQNLSVTLELTQPWGSVLSELTGSNSVVGLDGSTLMLNGNSTFGGSIDLTATLPDTLPGNLLISASAKGTAGLTAEANGVTMNFSSEPCPTDGTIEAGLTLDLTASSNGENEKAKGSWDMTIDFTGGGNAHVTVESGAFSKEATGQVCQPPLP